jgi:hypothetical protein
MPLTAIGLGKSCEGRPTLGGLLPSAQEQAIENDTINHAKY